MNYPIEIDDTSVKLYVKREDLLHPVISGNKMRKLKYNIQAAQEQQKKILVTFGGAFSNHIAAVAAAGAEYGFNTIGIIRGDELAQSSLNPTLAFATKCGMRLEYVSREVYRDKNVENFRNLLGESFSDCYFLPEGGTNELAVRGCEEILTDEDFDFDYICCAVGTGGTIAGIANSAVPGQVVLGFPALQGRHLETEVRQYSSNTNWELIHDYSFGGYAKITEELVRFINSFKRKYGILLDPVYTGKMFFGVIDLIAKGYFPVGSKILMIHTGGLQGITGMNTKLQNKHLPLIETND